MESPSVPPTLWFRRPCLLYAVVLIFRSLLTLRFHYKRCIFAHSTQSLIHTLTCTPIRLCRVWMKLLISYFERVLPLIWTKKHMYGSIKYLDIAKYKVQGFQEYLNFFSKGQLISKWFFGVVDFLQKTNENMSHSSKNKFVRSFFGRIHGLTICFRN